MPAINSPSTAAPPPVVVRKFRFIPSEGGAGKHVQDLHDASGRVAGVDGKPVEVTYSPGEVFWSPTDLTKFNVPGMSTKFAPADDSAEVTPVPGLVIGRAVPDGHAPTSGSEPPAPAHPVPHAPTRATRPDGEMATLAHMSVGELRRLAEEEEVDLKGARTKDDILKALRG